MRYFTRFSHNKTRYFANFAVLECDILQIFRNALVLVAADCLQATRLGGRKMFTMSSPHRIPDLRIGVSAHPYLP